MSLKNNRENPELLTKLKEEINQTPKLFIKNSKEFDESDLISVIVPIYNRQDKITRCYKSIINQTYQNLEIIFVNDGSTDNTRKVLSHFRDPRLKIIDQANTGPFEARRKGFEASHGTYICFVDSDDTLSKNYLKKMYYTIKKTNTSLCLSRIVFHLDYSVIDKFSTKSKKLPLKISFSKQPQYLPAMQPFFFGKLFKREALELKEIPFRANEDLAIMYSHYVKIDNISVNNYVIYHYYHSGLSQRNLLFGYKFENIYNTFGPLNLVVEDFRKKHRFQKYHQELEMLFIKNIFERINNMTSYVENNAFLIQFENLLLDYLECYFPSWRQNPYYRKGFPLGEITDRVRLKNANRIIRKIKHRQKKLTLEDVYDKYIELEKNYEDYLKNYQ